MNKKIMLSGILVLLLTVTAGCGQKPEPMLGEREGNVSNYAGNSENGQMNQEPLNNPDAHGSGNSNESSPGQEQVKNMVIKAYFTDEQMDALIVKEKEISYSNEAEKYNQTLASLQHSGAPELLSLWEKVSFKETKLKDGMLTVDILLPDEARLGAGGESLALESLTEALFQFDEVKSIEVLVDGQPVETLMGHVELEHPILRK
ncbi:GerMN domain-containing protein [Paenibacillus lentus]|uniref:GerMN domain-containing protein n=1 Tax=Paenibacillus lentus TaxID=1338368 RepID=A0A3S8RWI8_9BACL|nr:GerMN domain-containing protein [Paenibacillus lentus]AZK47252.1 hypothetical protein EIM92_14695 [Paenibacillus lentus]